MHSRRIERDATKRERREKENEGKLTSSHEEVSRDENSYGVVDTRDLGSSLVVVDENDDWEAKKKGDLSQLGSVSRRARWFRLLSSSPLPPLIPVEQPARSAVVLLEDISPHHLFRKLPLRLDSNENELGSSSANSTLLFPLNLPKRRRKRFLELTLHPPLPLIRLLPIQEPQILPSLTPLARSQPNRQSSHQRQSKRPRVVDLVLLGPETRSIGEEGQPGAETEDGEGENEVVVRWEEGGEAGIGS